MRPADRVIAWGSYLVAALALAVDALDRLRRRPPPDNVIRLSEEHLAKNRHRRAADGAAQVLAINRRSR